MNPSSLSLLPVALAVFCAGAVAGRALASVMRLIAQSEGYPSSRYYTLRDSSRWAALPILGHFLSARGGRSRRLFLLEAAGGIACLSCWALFPGWKAACGALFLLALLGAALIDLDHMIIPDLFSIGLAVAGLVCSALVPALHGAASCTLWTCLRSLAAAGLGMAIGSAIVLWFSLIGEVLLGREVLGFGDVKFVGAIGAFCGWQGALFSLFGGAAIGVIVILAAAVHQWITGGNSIQLFRTPISERESGQLAWGAHFPFGPMLAAAAALYFLALHSPVDRYLSQYLSLF